ncbi:MAG TPA: class I SAM-dependent methyltransferase [Tepidisphaeraceae bacterium]|jgi:23S rRNA (cytosine1962-C5)-methyltransferase
MAGPSPSLADLLSRAIARRRPLIDGGTTEAYRVFSGEVDGVDGLFIDVYGPGAVLIVYEGRPPRWFDESREAHTILQTLQPLGVKAIYLKPFAKDRSKMGGELPAIVTQPAPLAGEPLAEFVTVREHDWQLEVRFYDGLSTGLFLDQRDNRKFVADSVKRFKGTPAVLNTFAYTCAFSVAAAKHGAATTSVDVSVRYLDWGRRNFVHNAIDPADHRFAKMDTFEFFGYAQRKGLRYDLIVLDPPSFASGNKRKGIRPWSSASDYARLVHGAADLLKPGGTIFASTNTQQLCLPGRLEREITKGLGRSVRYLDLPAPPLDFARDQDRFAALAFKP